MTKLFRGYASYGLCAGLALMLVACAGSSSKPGSSSKSGSPTTWNVRNSPVPVPYPVKKPTPPRGVSTGVTPITPTAPANAQAAAQTQSPGVVTVARGDTVYALSRRHGVDVKAIISANNLQPPYGLIVGSKIQIPNVRHHIVAKGDTSYSISRLYGVDLTELARMNGLTPPYAINLGQRLAVPVAGAASTSVATTTTTTAAPKTPIAQPSARQGFMWPVQGRLVSNYGPKAGGLHNDGINIAVAHGTPIRASDAGVVAYAGGDLKAYGNLVLVQHQGGWVTAYAHADEILVTRGQKVDRGQYLARVGRTGGVTTPQLHFEIRQGRRAVNPLYHLPK